MDFLKKLMTGYIVGVAAIIPGVSGGVLATVLGIYGPILDALSGFFKNIKKNSLFLFPFFLGGGLGFLCFSKIIAYLMLHFPNQVLFLFSGFIVGGIPTLIAEANNDGFKRSNLFFLLLFFTLSISFKNLYKIPIDNEFIKYMLGGGIYSFGSIIPGISASFILINMGIYQDVLMVFTDFTKIIPFITGFLLTCIAIIKGVNYLFKKFHAPCYYSVTGLLLASVIMAMPLITNPITDISFLLVGIFAGFSLIKP